MYSETLKAQWKNLYCDFESEYDVVSMQGEKPSCLNRWYTARCHRWSSVTYAEGIILEQEKNPEFAQALKDAINNFQFKKVEPAQEKSVPAYCGIGVAAGVLVGVASHFFHAGLLKAILSGTVICAVAIAALLRYVSGYNESELKREKQAYVTQLRDYADTLQKVCEQYKIL